MKERFSGLTKIFKRESKTGTKLGDDAVREANKLYKEFHINEIIEKKTIEHEFFLLCLASYLIKGEYAHISKDLGRPTMSFLYETSSEEKRRIESLERDNKAADEATRKLDETINKKIGLFTKGEETWFYEKTSLEVQTLANNISIAYFQNGHDEKKLQTAIEAVKNGFKKKPEASEGEAGVAS